MLGYTIELKHDETETTWEDHGFVRLLTKEGVEIVAVGDVQHNRHSALRKATFTEMIEAVEEAAKTD